MKAVEPASSEGPEIVMNHATFRKRWQLASFLDGCARAGMERVSIWGDTVADTGLAQSRVLLGDAGLTVFGWNRAGPLLASEASERAALLEAARGQVRLAADFGADHVMVFTGGPPRGAKGLAGGRAEAQDAIAALLEVAQDAGIDLALYIAFLVPGALALIYYGYEFAADSWFYKEVSWSSPARIQIYFFKTLIPISGTLVLLQGIAEGVRCIQCIRTGVWPARLHDVQETETMLLHEKEDLQDLEAEKN